MTLLSIFGYIFLGFTLGYITRGMLSTHSINDEQENSNSD